MFFSEVPNFALFVLASEHESDFPDEAHLYRRDGNRTANIGATGRTVVVHDEAIVYLVFSEHIDKQTTFFVPDGKHRVPVIPASEAAGRDPGGAFIVSQESISRVREIHL